jgi:hypothetical protein
MKISILIFTNENFLSILRVSIVRATDYSCSGRCEKWLEKNEWMIKIESGDKEAFHHFYEAYSEYAIRTASAITRNREMAKDAVQETFIRVYRQIDSYNPDFSFDPWFYRILTMNVCDYLRRIRLFEVRTSRP